MKFVSYEYNEGVKFGAVIDDGIGYVLKGSAADCRGATFCTIIHVEVDGEVVSTGNDSTFVDTFGTECVYG